MNEIEWQEWANPGPTSSELEIVKELLDARTEHVRDLLEQLAERDAQLKIAIEALKAIDMARFPENGVEFTDVLTIADDALTKLK